LFYCSFPETQICGENAVLKVVTSVVKSWQSNEGNCDAQDVQLCWGTQEMCANFWWRNSLGSGQLKM